MASNGSTYGAPLRRDGMSAGVGAVAFGVLSITQLLIVNAPGGGYSAPAVTEFLGSGHRVAVIVVFHLAMLGVLGLVWFVAGLRDLGARVAGEARAYVVSGLGFAAAACFAIGWAVDTGQALAHTEGGADVVIPKTTTYLISQVGVTFVFGCGAMLLGLALLAFVRLARPVLSRPMRVALMIAGVAGFAGLAFFTFFLQLLIVTGVGVALLVRRDQAGLVASSEMLLMP
jgi:hypothetical protein